MIAAIGIMIGFYIITRMQELSSDPKTKQGTKVLALITGVVTIICMLGLFGGSSSSQI